MGNTRVNQAKEDKQPEFRLFLSSTFVDLARSVENEPL
jgi:hypothetical protein